MCPSLNNADDNLDWLSARKIGNTYVISMNSQDPQITTVGGDQYNYVQGKLTEAKALRAAGTIDWIVVIIHKPWVNMLSSQQPEVLPRHTYAAMFDDAQVDFVFSGHNHNNHIWRPVVPIAGNNTNTGVQLKVTMTSDGRFNFALPHGPTHAIFGNGGHEHNSFGIAATSNVLYRNDTAFGYGILEVQGKQARIISKDVNGNTLYTTPFYTRGVDNVTPPPTNPTPCVDAPPPPIGTCPQGYHKNALGQCVQDSTTPPTPPPATQPVMVLGFVGDTDGSTPQQIYANMKSKGVTKFGHMGDVVYSSSASEQLGYITAGLGLTKENMVCSIGNHDHPNEDGSQGVLDSIASYFNLPTSTYAQSRQWQNVYVIAMNTQDSNFSSTSSAQYLYVKSELEKATALKAQGSVNWIIVLIHKPFYIGSGNDHPADEEGGRSIYQALFDTHQVDFVYHGHNHNMDILKPLKSGGILTATVSNNVYDFTKTHGQFYLTIGSGGRARDGVSNATNSQYTNGGSYGYALMTLNNTGLVFQIQILSQSGAVLHQWQVSKQGIPPATGGGGGTDPPPTTGGGAGNPPADLPSSAVLVWDSGHWSNGQQRTITCHQCEDPFDERSRIGAGSGRKWFIDGQGNAFISGDQSRMFVVHNTYNHVWQFKFTWNGNGIVNLSCRSRSRHGEPDPPENRFGGYGLAIHDGSVEWAREDYHNEHTDMTPSDSTGTPDMIAGKEYGVRIFCYDNTSGIPTLKLFMDSGAGYVLVGTATDPNPEDYMLDKELYHEVCEIWIRTNGSNTRDVKIRDLKIYDLGDNYTG